MLVLLVIVILAEENKIIHRTLVFDSTFMLWP